MIKQLCNDIYVAFLAKDRSVLLEKIAEFSQYFYYHHATAENVTDLLVLEKKIVVLTGQYRQRVEDAIFEVLMESSIGIAPAYETNVVLNLDKALIEQITDKKERGKCIIALKLANFAIETFSLNKARDNFRSRRKVLCLELLGNISHYYDIPDVFDLSVLSLKSRMPQLIIAAIGFQESYTQNRNTSLNSEVIRLLDKIVRKTRDHSTAVCALDLQVTEGHMSRVEALRKMGQWKEKNEYWK